MIPFAGEDLSESTWLHVRTAYWEECVDVDGAEGDYVGLSQALLQAYGAGETEALERSLALLGIATRRHPRAVVVWEHLAAVASMAGRTSEVDEALAVIERLDPSSVVLSIADDIGAGQVESQPNPLTLVSSKDETVRIAALQELHRRAQRAPENSTEVVNYALGLMAAGRKDDARETALAAKQIEDGTFADAYNIGLVLTCSGAHDAGRSLLASAVERATSKEERTLALDLLARATDDAR
jgi:hypothetical protein